MVGCVGGGSVVLMRPVCGDTHSSHSGYTGHAHVRACGKQCTNKCAHTHTYIYTDTHPPLTSTLPPTPNHAHTHTHIYIQIYTPTAP